MASVNFIERGSGGYMIRFRMDGKTANYYMAGAEKNAKGKALEIGFMLDTLVDCRAHGITPDAATRAWIASTKGKLREALVKWGFAEPGSEMMDRDDGKYLEAFVQSYIEGRKDLSPRTLENFRQLKLLLVAHFGAKKLLNSITPNDATKWHRWLSTDKKLAGPTVSKHGKRAKQIFATLVQDKILQENPFAHLKGTDESNPDRFYFVNPHDSKTVLDSMPNIDWKCIFALARWGGMRCPSEVLAIKWDDVLWDQGRIKIDSSKTGLRFCPIFPELKEVLDQAWDLAPEGAVYVVSRYRDSEKNLRTHFVRLVEKAGIKPWEKPFQNLRSTRRTELQKIYPSHVCDCWMGQSEKVAQRHYLQVTTEDWAKATSVAHVQNGVQEPATHGARTEQKTNKKRSKIKVSASNQHPRQDSNLRPTD